MDYNSYPMPKLDISNGLFNPYKAPSNLCPLRLLTKPHKLITERQLQALEIKPLL
jgi:hypothetical protein